MQGLYDGMNFLAGVVSALGFIALVLALIGLGQKPRGGHFMFSIITLGFFALLALPPAVADISTLIFVQKERTARPSSQMERLPSIYFPQAKHELLNEFCWGNPSYGCNVDLYKLAAHGGDVFLETGTDPIYRWAYVESNPECFNENRVVVFLHKQPQSLARSVCFLLSEVETSEAALRFEKTGLSDQRRGGRQILLVDQQTESVIDRQLNYEPRRSGYPLPLGNKMRQVRGLFGVTFEDYTDGAIFDMQNLIENLRIPGYPTGWRNSRQPNSVEPGLAPWRSDLAALGLESSEWGVFTMAFKASCQMWNEATPELQMQLLEIVHSNDRINTDCGRLGCYEIDESGEWRSVPCEF